MQSRRKFIQHTGALATGLFLQQSGAFAFSAQGYESKRPPLAERKFTSEAVEATIVRLKKQIADPELGWLFENCFPNTLDTTVEYEEPNGVPDTYVITGDIDAMWLRDSTAQVWPYLPLVKGDAKLRLLIEGVINRQKHSIILDPYANAFYKDVKKESEWKHDLTTMQPGIHERKWEIDSLCYPIRLAHQFWKTTGVTRPFDTAWVKSIELTVKTFKEQQRKNGDGPYTFQRTTAWATDGVPLAGYGYPVKPVGLICSIFRPSDDATIYPFLVPANFFAIVSLRQAAEMLNSIHKNTQLANECTALANEVEKALQQFAIINHQQFGKVYAYEVNGFGSFNLMDDANVPSLLSLPYLNAVKNTDPIYRNTRKLLLSENNPFFFKGKVAEGIGGPHAGMFMIWPLSITMRGLTATTGEEVRQCLHYLKSTHGGTGFMHESFHKDDASKFTRKWFAWANTLFGELVLHTSQQYPQILSLKSI
ncbi:glycoside hydrolase family 125 protein [Flavihumibacter rivuli]|uniref:glycoside hydrolase family 125 protein n=1 Tax=Flavihumibacter rivuli TaxID=2838156 RepID=UPI001BDDD7C3|nr:glycoside hydrolase family 125 protein [Flavihumibacter rivuli]ULQ56975.1 glycoside hydrolase family 125 protein [Flavihumibacter rivuli]